MILWEHTQGDKQNSNTGWVTSPPGPPPVLTEAEAAGGASDSALNHFKYHDICYLTFRKISKVWG